DADIVKPWDQKGYKMPGGTPYTPSGFMTFVGASAMVNGKTKGAFPAAKALLSAVYEGALVPFDTALKIEARWFTNIMMNPSSSAMIRSLFINKGALEKGAVRPAGIPDQSVKKVGVLGAGMMGAGIALVSAQAGIDVVLIDQSQENADRGKAYSASYMDKGIKRGKATEEKKQALLDRITATTDYAALADADLIIEAVFEDPKIKADVTAAVEAVIPEDCIFASNTSTLPITELAKASGRADQFIGIHFFSPVEKMFLVEIIRGQETGDRAVAKALDYARQIRKTPIVVNDARFFYANRCIIPYINEGIRMVAEWFPPKEIGLAEGIYGGWGNFGSAFSALALVGVAGWLSFSGGFELPTGAVLNWRGAIALTGIISAVYGVIYYCNVSDTPPGKVYQRPEKTAGLEVTSMRDFWGLLGMNVPFAAILCVLCWRLRGFVW
ncbi:MAG: MFS transporter, partial [Rhodobacteraceae bacterium]|nr:MFS transporter [Paracoccaceae bacterium]